MSSLRLVVGLGNPGSEYANTRHNVGFRVADALAERLDASFRHVKSVMLARGEYKNRELTIAKPLTYMNRSGNAVAGLCREHDVSPAEMVVVVDDLHLPVGTIRLRPNGSSGGHNGLAHVAERLGTPDFPRLRVGIGSDFADGEQVDYVLSPFTRQQEPDVEAAVADAVAAILTAVRNDLDAAMNQYN
ncbi:MAG: aminoacyl-tRNA hydrolase [Salinivenus sp.]